MYDLPPPPDIEQWPFGLIVRAAMYLGCGKKAAGSWTLESLSNAIRARSGNQEYAPDNTIRNWIYGDTGIDPNSQSTVWAKTVLFEQGEIGAKPEAFASDWLRILDDAIKSDRASGDNEAQRKAARKQNFAKLVPGGGAKGFNAWQASLYEINVIWSEVLDPTGSSRDASGQVPEGLLAFDEDDGSEAHASLNISLANVSSEASALLSQTKEALAASDFGAAQDRLDLALRALGKDSDREAMLRDARARIYLEKSRVDVENAKSLNRQSWAAFEKTSEEVKTLCESSLVNCARASQHIAVSETDLVNRLGDLRRRTMNYLILAAENLEEARQVTARFDEVGATFDETSLAVFFFKHRHKDDIVELISAQSGPDAFNHQCVATALSKAWRFHPGYEILEAFLSKGVEVSRLSWGRVAKLTKTQHHRNMLISLAEAHDVPLSSGFFHVLLDATPNYHGARRLRVQARKYGAKFWLPGFTVIARKTRNTAEVYHLLSLAKISKIPIDAFFFNALISGASTLRDGRQLTVLMRRHGFKRDMVTFGTLMSKAANRSEVDKVVRLTKLAKKYPNKIFFNIMISKLEGLREAREVHACMKRQYGKSTSHGTYVSMLRVCDNPTEARFVQMLSRHHGCAIELKDGIFFERAVEKCTDIASCNRLIELMEEQKLTPNGFMASVLLNQCATETRAREMYKRLDELSAGFDEYAFSKLIDLSTTYSGARSWYNEMKRRGINANRVVMTTLVKRAGPGEAKALLKRFIAEDEELDAQLFTTIMLLSKRTEKYAFARAESILRAQMRLGVRPNKYSYQTVISYAKDKGEALPVLREMMDDGFTPNRAGWAMLNALGIYQADVLPKH